MTRREAELILGVGPGSDAKLVNERYRKLMLINHPDNGSTALTQAAPPSWLPRSTRPRTCSPSDPISVLFMYLPAEHCGGCGRQAYSLI